MEPTLIRTFGSLWPVGLTDLFEVLCFEGGISMTGAEGKKESCLTEISPDGTLEICNEWAWQDLVPSFTDGRASDGALRI